MYPAGNLFIPVEHGQLEAILKSPSPPLTRGAALVLHPHPLGGGTMHNKVVFRASAALNDAGLPTLRINFRGVGKSTGVHDAGRGESDDACAGLDYLKQNFPNDSLLVCGFSFGARVGMEVGMNDPDVKFLISIGTPLNATDFGFLERCKKPILFVHGEKDEFGNIGQVKELAEKISRHAASQLVEIKGAGHFFEGHLDELKSSITEWTKERFAE